MEYYSATKKDGIMSSAVTWMQLDIIILSEMSEKERQIPCGITYEWDLSNDTNEPTYEAETESLTEQTGGCQGRGVGGGTEWEAGVSRHMLLYIGWINKFLICSTENYIQYPMFNKL